MKYRIMSDGKTYKVQTKGWFRWHDYKEANNWMFLYGPSLMITKYFSTQKQAKKWCKQKWGQSGVRVREYRCV